MSGLFAHPFWLASGPAPASGSRSGPRSARRPLRGPASACAPPARQAP